VALPRGPQKIDPEQVNRIVQGVLSEFEAARAGLGSSSESTPHRRRLFGRPTFHRRLCGCGPPSRSASHRPFSSTQDWPSNGSVIASDGKPRSAVSVRPFSGAMSRIAEHAQRAEHGLRSGHHHGRGVGTGREVGRGSAAVLYGLQRLAVKFRFSSLSIATRTTRGNCIDRFAGRQLR
jgi:hypothetical protein